MLAVRIGHECARGRATVDPVHDEERPLQRSGCHFQHHGFGHRHDVVKRLVRLELDPPVGIDQAADRIAAQDEATSCALRFGIETVGLATGAAGNALQVLDANVGAPESRQITRQSQVKTVVGHGRTHGAKSSVDWNPDGA